MLDDLRPLASALDALPGPLDCFIRDDDAGWDDDAQLALLDVTLAVGVPIDLAAIPAAVGDRLTRRLLGLLMQAPHLLGIHQHGARHVDHQRSGRKCEFGSDRSIAHQRFDLTWGWDRLFDRFGSRLDPIFTPPWNRCSEGTTPELLRELGYAALSRDRGGDGQRLIAELPISLDWSKHWRAAGLLGVAQATADALADCSSRSRPFGLMLHHADMRLEECSALRRMLDLLTAAPRLRWHAMRDLVAGCGASRAARAAPASGGA